MAIKHLPTDIQSLFSAISPIKSHKTAVEELVYNSLDANSTAIAIRLHIQDNYIQVVDNGNGIIKCDMKHVGQKYMSSKTVDVSTLKCVPNCYGYRGQSLSRIIEVCRDLNITSRYKNSDKTWAKKFHKGKEKKVLAALSRPSKGTTIEIQGFLYNLRIQKQAVNLLSEIQEIKLFLERLALVHNNVSISLRDNSKNEVIVQIHKSKDIYQTLLTLFSIDKENTQELQVEKKDYKVKAFIGKRPSDENDHHWIYLNGRFMTKCGLHKIIDNSISKYLCLKKQTKKKKYKGPPAPQDENIIFKRKIPFYFIFIYCPYNDYDVNNLSKQCILEFSNWDNITKLLEKLIKFYSGETLVSKESNKVDDEVVNDIVINDTGEKIREIMNRILESTRKLGVSQMQNGIKGKMVKRNKRKKNNVSISKIIMNADDKRKKFYLDEIATNKIEDTNISLKSRNAANNFDNEKNNKPKKHKIPIKENKEVPTKKTKIKNNKTVIKTKIEKQNKIVALDENKILNNKHNIAPKQNITKQKSKEMKVIMNQNPRIFLQNTMEREFAVVKKHFNIIDNDDSLLGYTINPQIKHNNMNDEYEHLRVKKNLRKDFDCSMNNKVTKTNLGKTNDGVLCKMPDKQYSSPYHVMKNIPTNPLHFKHQRSKTICVPNYESGSEIDFGQNYLPIRRINTEIYKNVQINNQKFKSSRDLLQTVLPTQKNCIENIEAQNIYSITPAPDFLSHNHGSGNKLLTYESHRYNINAGINSHHIDCCKTITKRDQKLRRFITKLSRENFKVPQEKRNWMKYKTVNSKNCNRKHNEAPLLIQNRQHFEESFYSIEFSKSGQNTLTHEVIENIMSDVNHTNSIPLQIDQANDEYNTDDVGEFIYNGTYTLNKMTVISDKINQNNYSQDFIQNSFKTYSIKETTGNNDEQIFNSNHLSIIENSCNDNNINVECVMKPQQNGLEQEEMFKEHIDPLNVCETILNSPANSAILYDQVNKPNNNFIPTKIRTDFSSDEGILDSQMLSLPSDAMATYNDVIETSHHFNDGKLASTTLNNSVPINKVENKEQEPDKETEVDVPITIAEINKDSDVVRNTTTDKNLKVTEKTYDFNFKHRPRFFPKGMSPLLKNSFTKSLCDYNLKENYFDKNTYNNFTKAVETNTEIFEANVRNVNQITTKELVKVNAKLKKDNASLNFDGNDLKDSEILGQVDQKFIAAKMREKASRANDFKEYLVLFDQHAVHERIRLENNLSDYLTNKKWNSVSLDEVIIKLKHDDILYLHNYTEKFEQLGLKWSVVNDREVCVTDIPQAVLGKHDRQAEIIMKAVKNLILEEIEVMKTQKGSISMFPKSIMDLVFSEACRYAIKFGDKLSKDDCSRLLLDLSKCKTPFQCAHGRPVMAVLSDIQCNNVDYKINIKKLMEFKKKRDGP